ncbi:MAG: hypothetical protein MK135_07285, partial [Polyangiaceae bacterium]|nr:hypothetical protein [Polyangiaceae bacterium]
PFAEAYALLVEKAPSEIQKRLETVLSRYHELESLPQKLEHLHTEGTEDVLSWSDDINQEALSEPPNGWLAWRQFQGVIDRRSPQFYDGVWRAFRHVPALVIGDKLERKNHVESSLILSDMTAQEPAFAFLLEHLINKIPSPEYRQLNLEALSVLASFFTQNQSLKITDPLYLDAIIGHAVRLLHLRRHPSRTALYEEDKVDAWRDFYASSPSETTAAIAAALRFLLGAPEPSVRGAATIAAN